MLIKKIYVKCESVIVRLVNNIVDQPFTTTYLSTFACFPRRSRRTDPRLPTPRGGQWVVSQTEHLYILLTVPLPRRSLSSDSPDHVTLVTLTKDCSRKLRGLQVHSIGIPASRMSPTRKQFRSGEKYWVHLSRGHSVPTEWERGRRRWRGRVLLWRTSDVFRNGHFSGTYKRREEEGWERPWFSLRQTFLDRRVVLL